MNKLTVFNNPEFGEIRTTIINNEPYLLAKDVAEKLGYSNPPKAIRDHVDDEDKLTERIVLSGQNREVFSINESDLYSLILSSKLPNAKKFKHWVTSEVLPSIRKHGTYMSPEIIEEAILNPDTMIRIATELKAEREKRRALEAKVEGDKPKVLFADAVAASKTSILIGELAKLLRQNGVSIGQNRLFDWMRNNGYLCGTGERRNLPTQKAMELGLFEIKETVVNNPDGSVRVTRTPKVTGKGQTYFVNKFISH